MGVDATPQIIFKDAAEWSLLVKTLVDAGGERIDMNLGCPFPPQVKRGRGAGMLRRVEELKAVAELMDSMEQVQWSVKMRLGVDMADEALALAEVINQMRLRHVTVHPRTAGQQYSGTLHTDALSELASALRHPVVFNGDITTPEQIDAVMARGFAGVMVGRGLLSRPSLYSEWRRRCRQRRGLMLTSLCWRQCCDISGHRSAATRKSYQKYVHIANTHLRRLNAK